jgi:LPS-assembly protein
VGQRLYAEAGVTYPMVWTYGFLRPTAKYRTLDYRLERQLEGRAERPGARSALPASTAACSSNAHALAGRDVQQTLEPRIFYLYSQYDEQSDQPDFDSAELTFNYNQLFRDTRFSGRDRLDDANQVSIGLTTRFLDARSGRGVFQRQHRADLLLHEPARAPERLGPGAGSPQFGTGRRIQLLPQRAPVVRSNLQYDPSSGKMNAGNFLASYTREDRAVFNVGYTYRRPVSLVGNQPVTEQSHLSTYYPINNNWRFFMAWNYSLEAHRSVEDMLGFEYDSCCWRIRLLYLRYFDTVRDEVPNFDSPELDRKNATRSSFSSRASVVLAPASSSSWAT